MLPESRRLLKKDSVKIDETTHFFAILTITYPEQFTYLKCAIFEHV